MQRKPLPVAGQSLREEVERLWQERLIPLLVLPLAFVLVWMVEWVQTFAGKNLDPQFWALIALLVTIYGGAEVFRLRPGLRTCERAESRVGKILERIRAKGFIALYDLRGDNFAIDQVVVGPAGIFAIETKVRTGSGEIDYRSESELIFAGRISDGRALAQARASAGALQEQLRQQMQANYCVQPVLVFAGDWQVRRAAGDFDVDVVTAEQLQDYFERQPPELTAREIAQICSHLERSTRS